MQRTPPVSAAARLRTWMLAPPAHTHQPPRPACVAQAGLLGRTLAPARGDRAPAVAARPTARGAHCRGVFGSSSVRASSGRVERKGRRPGRSEVDGFRNRQEGAPPESQRHGGVMGRSQLWRRRRSVAVGASSEMCPSASKVGGDNGEAARYFGPTPGRVRRHGEIPRSPFRVSVSRVLGFFTPTSLGPRDRCYTRHPPTGYLCAR